MTVEVVKLKDDQDFDSKCVCPSGYYALYDDSKRALVSNEAIHSLSMHHFSYFPTALVNKTSAPIIFHSDENHKGKKIMVPPGCAFHRLSASYFSFAFSAQENLTEKFDINRGARSISMPSVVSLQMLAASLKALNADWNSYPITSRIQETETVEYEVFMQCHANGKVLDVKGSSKENKAPIVQWDYTGEDSQKWVIKKLHSLNGWYIIVNKKSGKLLSADKTECFQEAWKSQGYQCWNFSFDSRGNVYSIINSASKKVLDGNPNKNGEPVFQWDKNGEPHQKFRIYETPKSVSQKLEEIG